MNGACNAAYYDSPLQRQRGKPRTLTVAWAAALGSVLLFAVWAGLPHWAAPTIHAVQPRPPLQIPTRLNVGVHQAVAESALGLPRRHALLVPTAAAWVAALGSPASAAATEEVTHFEDYTFSLDYPSSWQQSETELPGRRRAVFFTRGKNENENINVVFTQVSGDYTKIGAFGTLEDASVFFTPNSDRVKSKLLGGQVWQAGEGYLFEYAQASPSPCEKNMFICECRVMDVILNFD
eukprot:EG_transcript_14397